MRAASAKRSLEPAHRSLSLNARGELRLAVVADTHSKPHDNVEHLLRTLAVDAILHAGDIGDLAVLAGLERIAPVIAVRGNIDEHAEGLPDALCLDLESGNERVLRILLTHIAVYGAKIRADAARMAQEQGATLIVCGHSHVPFMGRDRGLMVFNPGSIGPRRFQLPIVFGLLEIKDAKLRLRHVDCETGADWSP